MVSSNKNCIVPHLCSTCRSTIGGDKRIVDDSTPHGQHPVPHGQHQTPCGQHLDTAWSTPHCHMANTSSLNVTTQLTIALYSPNLMQHDYT